MIKDQIKNPRPWQNVSMETARRSEIQPAGFVVRLEAGLIDYMLCLVGAFMTIWVGSLLAPYPDPVVLAGVGLGGIGLVFVFNHVALAALTGQTVGKMILAIRVIRTDGRPLEWIRMLGRGTVGYFLSAAPLGLGFIWVLWDSAHQGWHDKIFSTSVVRTR
jgi:uncharacterized RDD family membrane protein YckC